MIFSDDYAHSMGCYADVLTYFDGQCSGRSGCKVVIGSLDAVAQPCPKDFKSYLEATYACINGMLRVILKIFFTLSTNV